jgi:hypothetical protein
MLISERVLCVFLESCGIVFKGGRGLPAAKELSKSLFDLGSDFKSKSIKALGQVADVL